MKKLSTEEKVLDYIIKALNGKNTNQYHVYNTIVESIGVSEQEIIQSLYFLHSDNLIKIIKISPHNNFSCPCLIELTSSGFHYFDSKAEKSKEKRNNWIKFWIPVGISILALIISGITLLLKLLPT